MRMDRMLLTWWRFFVARAVSLLGGRPVVATGRSMRELRASQSRKRLAAAMALLSMFSCSYGDREDREEDDKAKRVAAVHPPAEWPVRGKEVRFGQESGRS
jgi:hypothetical protein